MELTQEIIGDLICYAMHNTFYKDFFSKEGLSFKFRYTEELICSSCNYYEVHFNSLITVRKINEGNKCFKCKAVIISDEDSYCTECLDDM